MQIKIEENELPKETITKRCFLVRRFNFGTTFCSECFCEDQLYIVESNHTRVEKSSLKIA